jgi:hypothetical protein
VRSRFQAVINDTVLLRYSTTRNGLRYDVYQWNKVEIYDVDPRDHPTALPIQTISSSGITREEKGLYNYLMNVVTTAGVYYDKQYYIPEVGEAEFIDVEQVIVNEATPPSPLPPCATKIGYTFGNYVVPPGEWGTIFTPDDVRFTMLWGIETISTSGEEILNTQLMYAVDAATRYLEKYLNIDIYRRIYKTAPANTLVQAVRWRQGVDYTNEEDVYPFRPEAWKNYGFIQLRHYPLIQVSRCQLYSITHSLLFDALKNNWLRVEKEAGQLYQFPTNFAFPYGPPSLASIGGGWLWLQSVQNQYPGGFEVDYETGFKSSDWVPTDIRDAIRLLAEQSLLKFIGDGLLAGFSSSSIGIDGLSEAFSSTQSATSPYFGGRLFGIEADLKLMLPRLRYKYANIPIAFL